MTTGDVELFSKRWIGSATSTWIQRTHHPNVSGFDECTKISRIAASLRKVNNSRISASSRHDYYSGTCAVHLSYSVCVCIRHGLLFYSARVVVRRQGYTRRGVDSMATVLIATVASPRRSRLVPKYLVVYFVENRYKITRPRMPFR